MEKQPEKKEPRERKEGRAWWSKLGVVALASSMTAACVDIERRSTAQVGSESGARILAEHGMQVAGEDPQISWETEDHIDAQGYLTGSTLHAKITTGDKVYRVDLEKLPPSSGRESGQMDNPMVPAGGYPVSGGADLSSASWFDTDAKGNGVVLEFTPLVDQKGETALRVTTKYFKHGEVWDISVDVGKGEPKAKK